jgi:hypothetical protein
MKILMLKPTAVECLIVINDKFIFKCCKLFCIPDVNRYTVSVLSSMVTSLLPPYTVGYMVAECLLPPVSLDALQL